MYKDFFDLHEYPFTSSPDPKYFFPGKSHEEALLYLQYSVFQGEGFTLITGDEGVGKTIICRAFIECPDEQVNTAFISYSRQNPKKLLENICAEFGIKPRKETLKDFIDAFNNFLMQKKTEGKRVVVYLDDAHKYEKDVLEQLRLLSNLETTREKLLQIVLIGRPELSEMLSSHDLRPLGQRVTVSYHLRPLSENETFQYIIHRIAIAGLGIKIRFESSAIKQIYHYTNGVPQTINSVCDKALMAAFKIRHKHISGQVVKTVIKDLQSESKFPSVRINQLHTINPIKLFGFASILILVLFILTAVLFQKEAPEIKPAIVRSKIAERHTNNQIQKFQPSKINNMNHDETDKKIFDTPSKIQTTHTEEKNGKSGDVSSQISYSIQVGAYLVFKNAQDKISELGEKGYAARIVNFEDSKGRIWYAVRVGNYASKKLAQEDAKILSERDEIEAVVLPSDKF